MILIGAGLGATLLRGLSDKAMEVVLSFGLAALMFGSVPLWTSLIDRLWGGQVPEALRPVVSESAQAGQPTENGVTT